RGRLLPPGRVDEADGGETHGDADQRAAEGGIGDRGAGGRQRMLEQGHEHAGRDHEDAEASRLDRVLRPVAGHCARGDEMRCGARGARHAAYLRVGGSTGVASTSRCASSMLTIRPSSSAARMVIPATRAGVNTMPAAISNAMVIEVPPRELSAPGLRWHTRRADFTRAGARPRSTAPAAPR